VERAIHVFDNGVRVYDDHLLPIQRERYARRNVHEAEEEDVFTALVRNLPPGGRYINIGTAIGYYPLLAKRLAPGLRIHGVEPLPQHREYFLENIRLNGFPASAFTIHPEAVSASSGTAALHEEHYGSSLIREPAATRTRLGAGLVSLFLARLGLRIATPKHTRGTAVTTITLDQLLRRIGGRADLVQMDVQGFEIDVLRGGRRALRDGAVEVFLIGTHGAAVHNECLDLLTKHSYAIELSLPDASEQPDGILVASRTGRALAAPR
jgi:FkbM family methyltransferase